MHVAPAKDAGQARRAEACSFAQVPVDVQEIEKERHEPPAVEDCEITSLGNGHAGALDTDRTFSAAVRAAGMRSWLGDAPATWLAPRWGDVYLHETAISHIRRLLDTRFTCCRPNKTPKQFRKRLDSVQDHMNSEDFAVDGTVGLTDLAKSFRSRCEQVVFRKGERIPK